MRRALAALACVACGDNGGPPFVPLPSGTAQLALEGGELVFSHDRMTLLRFPASAFQIGTVDDLDSGASFDPYWLFVDNAPEPPEGLVWHTADSLEVIASDVQGFTLAIGDYGTLRALPSTNGCFALSFSSSHPRAAYLRVSPTVAAGERYYGLGEWGDGIEHTRKLRPMQIEPDLSLESSYNEDHVPVPLLVSTGKWGMFVASDRPGVFDVVRMDSSKIDVAFGTAQDSAAGLPIHLFSANRPLDLFQPYYEVAGYPGLPAEWAYGPLLWRNENRDQAQVMDDIQQIRTRDLATSGMWFDRPYASGVNTFDWNPTKFPAPPTMLSALHDAGLRYGIWQAPYVAPAGNDDPSPTQNAFATANGFFPPVTGVSFNAWGKPIDFTNPDAYAWWQQNLRTYSEPLASGGFGVEGFKLDYAEDIVLGISGQRVPWQFADGSDERTMHYGYTMLYHKIHRELLDESGGFLLTRSGRWGDQVRGMIVWPGDLQADLSKFGDPRPGESTRSVGGLPTALSFGIGLSASGFPFYASDTGGYRSSPPNNETWLRWVEANAVWPAMQVGDASSQMPWEFNAQNGRTAESLATYQRYARLHLRLFAYVWSYAVALRINGRPIVRPVELAYTTFSDSRPDQYMLGDWIFVAPVIEAGQTSRDVVFPPGEWIDWWTGEQFTDGLERVDADLHTLPLYIARGGIVPMLRDTIDTLAPAIGPIESYANDPGILFVRIAAGPFENTFTMYDTTLIETSYGANQIVFTPGDKFTKGVMFELIARYTMPTAVRADGTLMTMRASFAALQAAADGWFWDAAQTGGTLWIKVPGAATLRVQ